jgi:hypothetical protein
MKRRGLEEVRSMRALVVSLSSLRPSLRISSPPDALSRLHTPHAINCCTNYTTWHVACSLYERSLLLFLTSSLGLLLCRDGVDVGNKSLSHDALSHCRYFGEE